jgi:hypothetical protein
MKKRVKMASADEMGMAVRFISKEISGAPESLIYLQDLCTDQLNKRINIYLIMYEINQSTGKSLLRSSVRMWLGIFVEQPASGAQPTLREHVDEDSSVMCNKQWGSTWEVTAPRCAPNFGCFDLSKKREVGPTTAALFYLSIRQCRPGVSDIWGAEYVFLLFIMLGVDNSVFLEELIPEVDRACRPDKEIRTSPQSQLRDISRGGELVQDISWFPFSVLLVLGV